MHVSQVLCSTICRSLIYAALTWKTFRVWTVHWSCNRRSCFGHCSNPNELYLFCWLLSCMYVFDVNDCVILQYEFVFACSWYQWLCFSLYLFILAVPSIDSYGLAILQLSMILALLAPVLIFLLLTKHNLLMNLSNLAVWKMLNQLLQSQASRLK